MQDQNRKSIKIEIVEKLSTLMAAGFGLVAALAWNDAIQSLFQAIFPSASNVVAKFIYAVLITVLVVLVTTRLARLADRLKKE
ncbi:hypothetical protein HY477_01425 [Candidatus Uhrbacteria bacterium]|nr:hypothetical protein [Candidatus Uhrbacteria bacterium]